MLVLRANPEVTGARAHGGSRIFRSGGEGASAEGPRPHHHAPGAGRYLELRIAVAKYTRGAISGRARMDTYREPRSQIPQRYGIPVLLGAGELLVKKRLYNRRPEEITAG